MSTNKRLSNLSKTTRLSEEEEEDVVMMEDNENDDDNTIATTMGVIASDMHIHNGSGMSMNRNRNHHHRSHDSNNNISTRNSNYLSSYNNNIHSANVTVNSLIIPIRPSSSSSSLYRRSITRSTVSSSSMSMSMSLLCTKSTGAGTPAPMDDDEISTLTEYSMENEDDNNSQTTINTTWTCVTEGTVSINETTPIMAMAATNRKKGVERTTAETDIKRARPRGRVPDHNLRLERDKNQIKRRRKI